MTGKRVEDMEKKLLVLDVDGTLVNNNKDITPRTKDALFRAMEAGHSVMIASGRPTPGVQRYVEELLHPDLQWGPGAGLQDGKGHLRETPPEQAAAAHL